MLDGEPLKIFGQLIRTAVNVVALPVALVADVATMGGEANDHGQTYTGEALRRLKREASEDEGDD